MKKVLALILFVSGVHVYSQVPGNALNFDGSNDMVVVNATPSLFSDLNLNDFTFEAWVNPSGSVFSRIIFVQPGTSNFATMSTNTGNTIYFYVIANNVTYSIATTNSIPINQWTHVACVWTALTHTPQVYFNGVLQASVAGGSSSTGISGLMTLGTRPGGAQFFPGSLDEVRIWSEARTQCEIQANMNSEFNAIVPNLLVYYKFNEGVPAANNTLVTTLPTANTTFNGTLTDFGLTGATSNWIASGATINSVGPYIGPIGSLTTSICANDTFIFGGIPRTVTGTYLDTLSAANGCDSVATLNLTVLNPITSTMNETACDQYSFNAVLLSSSGTYVDTVSAANGCDSIITLNLVINNSATNTLSLTVCDQYQFNNNLLTSSGTYVDTIPAANGCDSIITLNLVVNSADITVNQTGVVLNSPTTNAGYQWLDCNNGFSALAGDTSSVYTATANGSYALQITQDGCTDTSACLNVVTFGLEDESILIFTIYPNPTDGKLFVQSVTDVDNDLVTVMNVNGEILQTKIILKDQLNEIDLTPYSSGIYYLQAFVNGKPVHYKVVKK